MTQDALWTAQAAQEATGGRLCGRQEWRALGVSIDTRTLQRGDLFVALRDVRDGHDFVAEALAKGAAACLVSRLPQNLDESTQSNAPLLLVKDVQRALEGLARAARARTQATVIGITGSVGKTSTKEMLRVMLEGQVLGVRSGQTGAQTRVHVAEASYNNHWGVPLTLARLPADCDYAVVEIGMNHPGEIAPLSRLTRPDAVMITTIAPAHLQAFESVEAIAVEKASILDGVRPGGIAVLNADAPGAHLLQEKAKRQGAQIVLFGTDEGCAFRLLTAQVSDGCLVAKVACEGQETVLKLAIPARHFALNALGALALVMKLGGDIAIAKADLGQWLPPKGRGTPERIVTDQVEDHSFYLLDDSFNANPGSMAAGLDVLLALTPRSKGQRIAILGDMLELGNNERSLHMALAHHPGLEAVSVIHCVGVRMKSLYQTLPRRQRGLWVENAQDLVPSLQSLVGDGDVVLVKGSKSMQLARVVDALRRRGHVLSRP